MDGSSPAGRRSRQWSSPDRTSISSLLTEGRNSELSHQDALAAAQVEHDRVREAAIRVFQENLKQQEHRRLLEEQQRILRQQQQEEERIRAEERLRAEEERLRVLKAKKVPQLPPEPPSPVIETTRPTITQQPAHPTSTTSNLTSILNPNGSSFGPQHVAQTNGLNGHVNGASSTTTATTVVSQPFSQTQTTSQAQPSSAPSPFAQPLKAAGIQPNGVPATVATKPSVPAVADRYVEIHQNLKKLRALLLQQSQMYPDLKKRMGDMRRELRKNMGQLVGEKGGNKKQIQVIQGLLDQTLNGEVRSQLVDPSHFITDKREPVEGAKHNESQLPALFFYLLNHFSKAVINQFINECGAQPKTADPIGVVVAMIFSKDAYLWRGKTLIDILMAKFRVVCPVLFGYHGSEKTEQGRLRLGWRKTNGVWAPEQQHTDRMKGLGAGYSAIALRNFSSSKNTNPWPPSKYWAAMARIVNTAPTEISNTQCIILRAIIESSEEKFIQFYGTAAIAALRKALVEFPNKAVEKTPGVAGLQVLAQILKRDIGLSL
ncbi:GLE1-domain-containing protein [Hypomontagnella monticulosa]|nr:GLE1-domain-containing protein [Hypomontagnella monticulosa]